MKAVNLLVDDALPEELKGAAGSLSAKEMDALMARMAKAYPELYAAVTKRLGDIGRNASYYQGETISLSDLFPVVDKQVVFDEMDAQVAALDPNDPDFGAKRLEIWQKASDALEKATLDAAVANDNGIANAVASGAKGKAGQLKMMLTTPAMYTDAKGNVIPKFVRRSFSEGIRPADFLASTYGARAAVLSTKRATAAGGDLGKQMVAAAADLVVTKKDCGTSNGIDLSADDPSLKGRVLAKDVAGIPAGTVLDKEELARIRQKKPSNVIVRSALTCENGEGLCSNCVGKFYNREFPKIGDAVGMIAGQSISEPITQNALNVKHSGGAAKGGRKTFSGFDVVNQIFQSPKNFPHRAAVSELEGIVKSVDDAPQGGRYITVGDKKHYVLPGMDVSVKVGQHVEAGDQLSDGIVDASDVVRLRGLGSGRRYFSDRVRQALEDSGLWADARNVEIVSRNAINHAKILDDEGLPGMLPDDLVSYNRFASKYIPAVGTTKVPTKNAVGKYLQVPALHYSVGTKLTNKMVKRLEDTGSSELYVADKEPQYEPLMNRLRTSTQTNPDWLARQHSSFLKKHLSDAAVRGEDADTQSNIHFAPRLAVGKDFGKNVSTEGRF